MLCLLIFYCLLLLQPAGQYSSMYSRGRTAAKPNHLNLHHLHTDLICFLSKLFSVARKITTASFCRNKNVHDLKVDRILTSATTITPENKESHHWRLQLPFCLFSEQNKVNTVCLFKYQLAISLTQLFLKKKTKQQLHLRTVISP